MKFVWTKSRVTPDGWDGSNGNFGVNLSRYEVLSLDADMFDSLVVWSEAVHTDDTVFPAMVRIGPFACSSVESAQEHVSEQLDVILSRMAHDASGGE